MQQVVILDYNVSSVSYYSVPDSVVIDESWIKSKHHNPDECAWMVSDDVIEVINDDL